MTKKSAKKRVAYIEFLYILPFIILVAVFSYYPLYGWVYSFFDYRPPAKLTMDDFVGLKWFASLVSSSVQMKQILAVMKNTFAMSGLNIATSWLPLLFAVFLNAVGAAKFKKAIQTITILPNFISWVLVYSVAFALLNNAGAVNSLLTNLGVIQTPIQFLRDSKHVWLTMWLWSTWKNLGWASIMYIAALSGIDEELYDAARIDGGTRMQLIVHITIPFLMPTYFVLLVLSIANFLSNGMEQYYVFMNSFNKSSIQVLDLYVFNLAMGSGSYSVSTAISMLKSLVSIVLLFFANTLSKFVRGESLL